MWGVFFVPFFISTNIHLIVQKVKKNFQKVTHFFNYSPLYRVLRVPPVKIKPVSASLTYKIAGVDLLYLSVIPTSGVKACVKPQMPVQSPYW